MVNRIKFKAGKQREFLDLVVKRLNCVSVRGILQFGFDISYASLKSYYTERRLMPVDFFDSLCYLAKIDKKELDYEEIGDNWGQVKGGRLSKRKS